MSYAKAFYGKEVEIGKSVDLIDPETKECITLNEIIVSGHSRATGYIGTKLESDEFLYFADVDKESDILTVYETATDSRTIFEKLKDSEDYLSTNKFDFIEFSQSYVTNGSGCGFWRRVWGSCIIRQYPFPDEDGNCQTYNLRQDYFLGLRMGPEYLDRQHPQGPCE